MEMMEKGWGGMLLEVGKGTKHSLLQCGLGT